MFHGARQNYLSSCQWDRLEVIQMAPRARRALRMLATGPKRLIGDAAFHDVTTAPERFTPRQRHVEDAGPLAHVADAFRPQARLFFLGDRGGRRTGRRDSRRSYVHVAREDFLRTVLYEGDTRNLTRSSKTELEVLRTVMDADLWFSMISGLRRRRMGGRNAQPASSNRYNERRARRCSLNYTDVQPDRMRPSSLNTASFFACDSRLHEIATSRFGRCDYRRLLPNEGVPRGSETGRRRSGASLTLPDAPSAGESPARGGDGKADLKCLWPAGRRTTVGVSVHVPFCSALHYCNFNRGF